MKRAVLLLATLCVAIAVPPEHNLLKEFTTGNSLFAASVYKELAITEAGNFIFSPLSAETILALTIEGARGKTAEEVVTGLHLPDTKDKIQNVFKALLPNLRRSSDDFKLLNANKVYVRDGVQLEDEFRRVATDVYRSGVENVNFNYSVEAAQKINSWVEDQTDHKIRNLIDPDSIDRDTQIVLVNALYFDGKWVFKFKDYHQEKPFYKSKDQVVHIPTMYQTSAYNYFENRQLGAKYLELPYKGGDTTMVIVLPNDDVEGLASLERNLAQVLAPQPMQRKNVFVTLPKFTAETTIEFVPILEQLGVRRIFSYKADLSEFSSNEKALFVTDVVQKAFINVTATGTQAGVSTGALVGTRTNPSAPPQIIDFKADHPFLYYIQSNGVILFVGRFTK